MKQDEMWLMNYREVVGFIEANHRNPSRYNLEERGLYCNWIKHNRKLLNSGGLKPDRVPLFQTLLDLIEKHRRVNQYE